jgi:plastocyanin
MKITATMSVLVSVGLLFLCATGAMAATNTIYIFNLNFGALPNTHIDPIINLGDTVTWVWTNGMHSTTATPGQLESWDSGIQTTATATNYSHTFSNLGTYNYYCRVHSESTGCRQAMPEVGDMVGYVAVMAGNQTTPYQINSITPQGNDILVSWITGGICMTNILQRSTGDAAGNFTTNFTDILTLTNTTGNVTNFLDVGAVTNFPNAYYRMLVPFP